MKNGHLQQVHFRIFILLDESCVSRALDNFHN
jgi:hypothetical protein